MFPRSRLREFSRNFRRKSRDLVIIVESEYGSNGNYNGNDRFSTPQIKNKTRTEKTLFFSTRILVTLARLVLWSR